MPVVNKKKEIPIVGEIIVPSDVSEEDIEKIRELMRRACKDPNYAIIVPKKVEIICP